MDKKMLVDLIEIGRKMVGQYWNENWGRVYEVYAEFVERILSGADPREITIENSKLPEDIAKIYWFGFGVSGPQIMRDKDVEKFREFLRVLIDTCSESEATNTLIAYDGKIRGLRVHALTTWAAILHPNWFTPLWGSTRDRRGIINPCSANILGISRIKTFDEYFDILSEIKDVARRVGIENLAEVAFYLTKCYELIKGYQ